MNHLPLELIKTIASFVNNNTLLALRLISRAWCEATYDSFAQRWLATLTTDFTTLSQRRLDKISQHQHLASRVRCLRVGCCIYPVVLHPLARKYQKGGYREPLPRCESGCLDLSSPEVSILSDMLLRFSNCTEFSIVVRRGEGLPHPEAPDQLNCTDICRLLFSLLDEDFASTGLSGGKGLQIHTFGIQVDGGGTPDTRESWPKSTELFSLLSRSSWSSHLQHLTIDDTAYTPSLMDVIKPLILTAASLQSLTLGHSLHDSSSLLSQLACAQQLPALSKLELMMLTASVASLSKFIGRLQSSLRVLSIDRTRVNDGTIGQVIGQLGALGMPGLKHITVIQCAGDFFCPLLLNQGLAGLQIEDFEVRLRLSRKKTRIYGVKYRGSDEGMGRMLSALRVSCYKRDFHNPSEPDTPDLSSGSVGIPGARVVQGFT